MRFGMLVPVPYDRLAAHLLNRAADVHNPLDLDFESIRNYLEESVAAMLADPESISDDVEDPDVTEILLTEYSFGSIEEIIVTRIPGIVVNVDGHLLKLPLVLIKI